MIWCVEDDASIRDIEVYALQSTGYEARGFEDGTSFLKEVKNQKPELVVLDVMLPGIDGITLLQKLKEDPETREIPVVMATAKGAEYDKIQGLDLGADYYLAKPFGVMEFVSCVKAVLRRCQPRQVEHLLKTGGLIVNIDEHTVTIDGERITLTYKEFELLRLFCHIRAWRLPETSCLMRSGEWTTAGIPVPWICISGRCGRSLRTTEN